MARSGNNSRIAAIGSYSQSSAPTFGGDLTELANDLSELIGEAESTPSALPLSENWPGRTIYAQSTLALYTWTESGWRLMSPEPWQTPTLAAGISITPGRLGPKYRKVPGGVEIQGSISGSSDSGYRLFYLLSGYYPAAEVRLWASQGGSIQVLASGQVNSPLSGSKALVDFNGFYPL